MTTAAEPSRRRWLHAVQVALTIAVIAFAVRQLWIQWTDASRAELVVDVRWGWLLLASALVLGTYLLMVEMWRQVTRLLGGQMAYGPAARIWFASNLGKYIPGKIWTVTAIVVMSTRVGVAAAVAGGTVVVITIAQAATGFATVALTSLPTVRELAGGTTAVLVTIAGLLVSLAAAPLLARQWNRIAAWVGKEQLRVHVPLSAVAVALVGSTLGWLLYGVAFQLLVKALVGTAAAPLGAYVAAYAASYLVGLLVVFAPGGIGAREWALAAILPTLGLATAAEAVVITVISRVWLTVLELVPSIIAALRSASLAPKR